MLLTDIKKVEWVTLVDPIYHLVCTNIELGHNLILYPIWNHMMKKESCTKTLPMEIMVLTTM